MAKRLDAKKWLEIKTRYQMGDAIRAIARDYNISDGTIHHKIKKKNWDQKLSSKLLDIQKEINNIEHMMEPEQMPLVQERLSEILQFQQAINNFVKGAVSLNNRNLQAVLAEPDTQKRITLTAKMRANMVDIAGITTVKPILLNEGSNDVKTEGVVIYIPDNKR